MSETRAATPQPSSGDAASVALRQALDRAASLSRERDVAVADRDRARADLRTEQARSLLAQETAVDNAIAQAESEHSAYKGQWAAAQAEGDFPKAAEVLGKMTEAAARLDRHKGQKEYLAQQRSAQPQAHQNGSDQDAGRSGSGSAQDLQNYAPHAREWISRNPQFLTDDAFRTRVIQQHHSALGAGHPEGTPGYYEHIERAVYPERFPTGGAAPSTAQTQDRDASSSAPDPTQQDQTGGGSSGPQIIIGDKDPQTMPTNQPMRDGLRLDVNADGTPVQITQEEQVRAVGTPGSAGMRSVAAPPSRALTRIVAGQQQNGPIHLSGEEMDHARSLFWSIEDPTAAGTAGDNARAIAAKGDIGIAEWYAGLRFSPAGTRYYKKHYGATA